MIDSCFLWFSDVDYNNLEKLIVVAKRSAKRRGDVSVIEPPRLLVPEGCEFQQPDFECKIEYRDQLFDGHAQVEVELI